MRSALVTWLSPATRATGKRDHLTLVASARPPVQVPAAPAPVPSTKPKPGTTAYCQTLKSASSRSACLKKLHAQATPKAAPSKKTKKPSTKSTPDAAQLTPAPAASARHRASSRWSGPVRAVRAAAR